MSVDYSRNAFDSSIRSIRAWYDVPEIVKAEQILLAEFLDAAHTDALQVDAEIMATIAHAAHDTDLNVLQRVSRDGEADALVLSIVRTEITAQMDALHTDAIAEDNDRHDTMHLHTLHVCAWCDLTIADTDDMMDQLGYSTDAALNALIRAEIERRNAVDHAAAVAYSELLSTDIDALVIPCDDCSAPTAHASRLCAACRTAEAADLAAQDAIALQRAAAHWSGQSTDALLCTCCALWLANRDHSGCEDDACTPMALLADADVVLTCTDDCEASFSTSPCDGCGSHLAGDRHPAVIFTV